MLLYTQKTMSTMKTMVSGNWHFMKVNVKHRKKASFSTKTFYVYNLWYLVALKTFGESRGKYTWWSQFSMEQLLWTVSLKLY